jgi:chemotaxis protein methyltransferase CheR
MKACSFGTVLAYYTYVTSSEKKDDELRELLNRLTVNHTYFFRNEPQFKALKEKVLPELIARKAGNRVLRIWSAGCSTGEEPYTIAMIVRDVIPDAEKWDIQILATDVSTEAMEAARKGVYGASSMRSVDEEHKDRYFAEAARTGHGAKYAISDDIKKMVSFGFFNLMDEDYPRGFDIIFCRNVTIYFGLETTISVVNKFSRSLDDDGCLFIGYSETLQFISDKFRMMSWEDAIFYLKSKRTALPEPSIPSKTMPVKDIVDAILEKISKAEFDAVSMDKAKRKRSPEFEDRIVRAIKAMHTKNYEEALSLTEEARSLEKNAPEPYYVAAEVYANQGKLKDAKDNLYAALNEDMLYAPAHYLFGSVCAEEVKIEAAEESYKRALYLDSGLSVAHFGLANIYRTSNRIDDALREYRNVLAILSKSKPYDIIAHSGGFNAATLASVCKNSIETLKTAG